MAEDHQLLSHLSPSNDSAHSTGLEPRTESRRQNSVTGLQSIKDLVLLRVLRNTDQLRTLSIDSWAELMPQARFSGLWPQLAVQIRRLGLTAKTPEPVLRHLQAAWFAADSHATSIRWEVDRIQLALADVDCRLILLKGSAFLLSGMVWAEGRYCQDVDILVAADRLASVEASLIDAGWEVSEDRPLHAQYFREWLQELPPMTHRERDIQLDIHHSIIPPKDRIRLDPRLLVDAAVPVNDGPVHVLAPADMFLHATSNSFRTGEFTFLLRDLYDMQGMLAEFSQRQGFWKQLLERTIALNLTRQCFYALRYLRELFETPIPPDVTQVVHDWRPSWVSLRLFDRLVLWASFQETWTGSTPGGIWH